VLLDLIDSLRCPTSHEESWLVLSADTWRERHIVRGRLGCPICHAEYPIVNGVADFSLGDGGGDTAPSPEERRPTDLLDPDGVFRLAAQLDLREPGGIVLLAGEWSALATALAALTPALFVALNPGGDPAAEVSVLRVTARLPLGTGVVRAAVLDARHAVPSLLSDCARVLRPGGRLVAPAAAEVPAGVRELARDAHQWVATAAGPPPPVVTLERAT
jgi:hypothetical protein